MQPPSRFVSAFSSWHGIGTPTVSLMRRKTTPRSRSSKLQAYNVLHDAKRRRQYDEDQDLQAKSPTQDVTTQAARVYLRRGIEAFKKKRYQEAATNLEQATQEDSKDPQAWYYLAQVYAQRTSLLSRALAAAAKACELDAANPDYLKEAGKLAAAGGMTSRAAKYYRDALTFGGEDAEVRAALKALKK